VVVTNDTQPILERLKADLVSAMRVGDQARKDVLRFTLTALTNERIARGKPLSPDEATSVVATVAKQLREAAELYRSNGDAARAAAEAAQAALLSDYLPAPLSDAELDALVTSAMAATGATSLQQLGGVIGAVKAAAGPRADGARIAERVRTRLA
jgi:uncharacterized protein YqeY